ARPRPRRRGVRAGGGEEVVDGAGGGRVTRLFQELERVESRILAAIRFVDASTAADLSTPLMLEVVAGRAVLFRNRSGRYVVASWSELAEHEGSFDAPPAAPVVGSRELQLRVSDPTGRYLPRRVTLALPRDPDAANAAEPDSLLQ